MIIYPVGIDIKSWFGCLITFYPKNNLPALIEENEWEKLGDNVAATGIFLEAQVPSPLKQKFESWEEWAKKVYICMLDLELIQNNKF